MPVVKMQVPQRNDCQDATIMKRMRVGSGTMKLDCGGVTGLLSTKYVLV